MSNTQNFTQISTNFFKFFGSTESSRPYVLGGKESANKNATYIAVMQTSKKSVTSTVISRFKKGGGFNTDLASKYASRRITFFPIPKPSIDEIESFEGADKSFAILNRTYAIFLEELLKAVQNGESMEEFFETRAAKEMYKYISVKASQESLSKLLHPSFLMQILNKEDLLEKNEHYIVKTTRFTEKSDPMRYKNLMENLDEEQKANARLQTGGEESEMLVDRETGEQAYQTNELTTISGEFIDWNSRDTFTEGVKVTTETKFLEKLDGASFDASDVVDVTANILEQMAD